MNAIQRISDLIPQVLATEMCKLYKHRPDWMEIDDDPARIKHPGHFYCRIKVELCVHPLMASCFKKSVDLNAIFAISQWVGRGPKVARPSREQCEALANVDVRIPPGDYEQPYPTLCVLMPDGFAGQMTAVLLHQGLTTTGKKYLNCCTFSRDHSDDITNLIKLSNEQDMEAAITRFAEEARSCHEHTSRCYRVAINVALLLSNFPHTIRPFNQADFDNNRRLINRGGETGARARERAALDMRLLEFSQDIRWHTEIRPYGEWQGGTHASPTPHWRRGHWARIACGPHHSERKLIFRPPVLVRAECFVGDLANTSTLYEGGTK